MTSTPVDSADSSLPPEDGAPPAHPSTRSNLGWPLLLTALVACAIALVAYAWSISRAQREEVARTQARLGAMEQHLDRVQTEFEVRVAHMQSAHTTMQNALTVVSQQIEALESAPPVTPGPETGSLTALSLEQIEILLLLGQQQARHADGLDTARALYTQAAALLQRLPDPALDGLRQTLATERAALEVVRESFSTQMLAQIDALLTTLDALENRPVAESETPTAVTPIQVTWWQRLLASWVEIRKATDFVVDSTPQETVSGMERERVRLQLMQARAYLIQGDLGAACRALQQIEVRIGQWPDIPVLQSLHAGINTLQQSALTTDLTTFGTSLEQLRRERREWRGR